MSNTKYTNEFKLEVITYYLDNHTVKETLSHYSISESALFAWKRKYDANCLGATNTQKFITINRMESHIEKMQKILDAQKILQCTSASSTAEKVKAIDALSEQFPIRVLCEAAGLPRGTYYHRKRAENKTTVYEKNDAYLKPIIKQIFDSYEYSLGKKPIKHLLEKQGIFASEHRISRLMKEMNLEVTKPLKLEEHKKPIKRSYFTNHIKNNYSATKPNAVWASDITYMKANQEYKYICVIIDMFSRKVLSYRISDTIDSILTFNTFVSAYENRGQPKELIFHSDQGSQYTSFVFRSYLKDHNITQSFSTPGSPTENAVCESFFYRLKYEALYQKLFTTAPEVEAELGKYIDYYNNRRPHRKLDFKTPQEIENDYYNNQSTDAE